MRIPKEYQQLDRELEAARLQYEQNCCFQRMTEVLVRLEKVAENLERILEISKNQG